MRVLIAGGFGYIGAKLAVHLESLGHEVVLGSRNAIKSPPWLPQAGIAKLEWENDKKLEQSCNGIEVVVHAAGMNAQDCKADPVAALSFNGVATSRLVKAASKMDVKRFIYLSTAHVYASPLVGVITERTCPRNMHPYATSHFAGENSVLGASQRGEFEGFVLRLSNVFGAPMYRDVNCWMLLVNDLCRQAVATQNLVLHTTGQQQRDFIGMSETCRLITSFVLDRQTSQDAEIINIGSGVSQTVLNIATIVQQRCTEILGFEPLLKSVVGTSDESSAPELEYQSRLNPSLDINTRCREGIVEIDNLLRFCKSAFASARE